MGLGCADRRLGVVLQKNAAQSLKYHGLLPLRTTSSVRSSRAMRRSYAASVAASSHSSVWVDSRRRWPLWLRYSIHQMLLPTRLNTYLTIMRLLALPILHLLFELRAEAKSNSDFSSLDVATHHAEVGNLLSLNPKIHRLRTDAKENRSFPHTDGQFVSDCRKWRVDCRAFMRSSWQSARRCAQLLRKWRRPLRDVSVAGTRRIKLALA